MSYGATYAINQRPGASPTPGVNQAAAPTFATAPPPSREPKAPPPPSTAPPPRTDPEPDQTGPVVVYQAPAPAEDAGLAWAKAQAAEMERRRVNNVVSTLRGVMNEYGLGALMGQIEGWVRSGLEGDAVMALVRESEAYNQRFPAMRALRGKMRAISEAAYIEFERSAAGLERQYGLPAGMLGKDAVTRLLTAEVSERELEQRVVMASSAAYQVNQEVRDQFRNFYGVDTGGLAAYFLDPERATPLLNKQFVASQIGAEAAMQDISIGVGMAEELQMAGIERETARQGFGRVAGARGLMAGRGDVATQEQLIQGSLLQDEQSLQVMERAAMARRGRFEGGGGFQTTQQGITGLGSSAGT